VPIATWRFSEPSSFFILTCNLIGLIPVFESPTNSPSVTVGCALATFLYYHLMGIRANGFQVPGPFHRAALVAGPAHVPIEIISNLARVLSLTVRLYANMFAGEQVTMVFLRLDYFVFPAVFHGSARIRGSGTGLHFHAAVHGVRGQRGGARAFITALCRLQCEPG